MQNVRFLARPKLSSVVDLYNLARTYPTAIHKLLLLSLAELQLQQHQEFKTINAKLALEGKEGEKGGGGENC